MAMHAESADPDAEEVPDMINDTPVRTVRRPRARLVALAVALVASSLATLAPTGVIEAAPPAANPADVSAAIR